MGEAAGSKRLLPPEIPVIQRGPTEPPESLGARIRDAFGLKPGEDTEFITPQFQRPVRWDPVLDAPAGPEGFDHLKTLCRDDLLTLGLRGWDDAEDPELWLIPDEWVDAIPDGYILADINGEEEAWSSDSDRDMRFGCLRFGVTVQKSVLDAQPPGGATA